MIKLDRTSFEPLYIQVKNDIIANIENGKIKIGAKLMSENEMQHYYKVGRMTIRAALSELVTDGCIRKEQGRGTFCVGYPQNSHRLNIDVLLDNGDAYFTPYVLQGISQVLEKEGCNLLLHDTKGSLNWVAGVLEDILKKGTDGLLIQSTAGTEEELCTVNSLMDQFAERGIPVVVLMGKLQSGRRMNIMIDEIYGAETAARYLLDCGHRDLLGLFYYPGRSAAGRLAGFRKAISQVPEATACEITTSEPYEEKLLELVREKKITAIQCYNDRVAVDCLRLLVENGFRVPEDVSLVGFDDTDLAINAIPRLTTVSHPKDHLGSAAANAVLHRIRNPEEQMEDMTYRPGLVIRQSVRRI